MNNTKEKERLVAIMNSIADNILSHDTDVFISAQADTFLERGVRVPPCKVDDKVYLIKDR